MDTDGLTLQETRGFALDILLTPAICRAARALADITQGDLAEQAGVSKRTVAYFETGEPISPRTVRDLQLALQKAGAIFLISGSGGIALTFQGMEGTMSEEIGFSLVQSAA